MARFVAAVALAGAVLLLENLAVFRMAEAAGSPVITEAMVHTVRMLVLAKWYLLFIGMFLCAVVLAPAGWILRFGASLLAGSAVAGAVAVAYDDHLLAAVVLVMFIGLCGVSALLAFKPEAFYSFSENEAPVSCIAISCEIREPEGSANG
jgi:hypothetical protein